MSADDEGRVVRARGFEVVDAEGNARAVLGMLGGAEPSGPVVGLELMTAGGERRASVAVGEDGSWVTLELGGNARVHVGIHEPGSNAIDARVFLYVTDADGVPVAGWRVTDDGRAVPVESA